MKTRRERNAALATPPAAVLTSDDEEESLPDAFSFGGKSYATYQDMVDAKRRRNTNLLASSGLLQAKAAVDDAMTEKKRAGAAARGLKRSKEVRPEEPRVRRKSGRLQGAKAEGIYIESEKGGRFEIAGGVGEGVVVGSLYAEPEQPRFYGGRVNDGSDLSVSEAVKLSGSKWVEEGTVGAAEIFMKRTLPEIVDDMPISVLPGGRRESPTSVAQVSLGTRCNVAPEEILLSQLEALSVNDSEKCVAKVTPERIYSVACHPSPDKIVACAGDKAGFLGIWNVDQYGVSPDSADATDGVHLFKPHSGAVSSLVWNPSGTALFSASYDGTVRSFDAEKQVFAEVFATYDDDEEWKDKLGYGLDRGYKSWVQSLELDHRFSSGKCFFLCTSDGGVMHIDLRSKGKVTFDQRVSEKKVNTISLHPEGRVMATAGLSAYVQLWDVRKISSHGNYEMLPKPLAWQFAGRSINSAFFSPTGDRLLTTTQSNKLEILRGAHLTSGKITPVKSIRHDNQTGRWLSTFMARWHPGTFSGREIFVVGSMRQPRTVEIWDDNGELLRELRGEALTAVASRCCFHPNVDRLVTIGGNSSGRVTVAQ